MRSLLLFCTTACRTTLVISDVLFQNNDVRFLILIEVHFPQSTFRALLKSFLQGGKPRWEVMAFHQEYIFEMRDGNNPGSVRGRLRGVPSHGATHQVEKFVGIHGASLSNDDDIQLVILIEVHFPKPPLRTFFQYSIRHGQAGVYASYLLAHHVFDAWHRDDAYLPLGRIGGMVRHDTRGDAEMIVDIHGGCLPPRDGPASSCYGPS